MTKKEFNRAFDTLAFSPDFTEDTKRLLTLAAEEKEKDMKVRKLTKRGKTALVAAALALLLALGAGAAAAHFMLPREAQEYLQMEDLHIADVLADGEFDIENITAVQQAVKSNGHTIAFEAIVEGTQFKADIMDVLAAKNEEDLAQIEKYPVPSVYAVITVTNDAGGPVLGLDPDFELHDNLGCCLCVQGIEPIVFHYAGQFTVINDVAYMFIPLHEAIIFADRELRLCVYEDFAPAPNILTLDKNGVPAFNRSFKGLKAMFELEMDRSFADHDAVAELEAKYPLLPTDWEKEHGLAP